MKKVLLLLILSIALINCGGSDDSNSDVDQGPSGLFFSANIDGTEKELTNVFGDFEAINSFFSQDAVYIEVRDGDLFSNTIILSIQREDVKIGSYTIGENSIIGDDITHIDYNASGGLDKVTNEDTTSGVLNITELDTENLIIQGNFEFNSEQKDAEDNVIKVVRITNGKFRIKYLEKSEVQ